MLSKFSRYKRNLRLAGEALGAEFVGQSGDDEGEERNGDVG